MAIVAHIVFPGLPRAEYDRVRAETGWLEKAPVGGLSHITWWEGEDCHNIDAWESDEALNTFNAERLGPAMARTGTAIQPRVAIHPAYEVFVPAAVTVI